jgi:hypothetical protein
MKKLKSGKQESRRQNKTCSFSRLESPFPHFLFS